MKQDGMYRYCIQFRAHTESEIRAGELLEKLGRKKSAVIIAALLEYMDNHPELTDGDQSHVTVNTMSLGALEAHISRLIEEKLRVLSCRHTERAFPMSRRKKSVRTSWICLTI